MQQLKTYVQQAQHLNTSNDLATARLNASHATEYLRNTRRLVQAAKSKTETLQHCQNLQTQLSDLMPDFRLAQREQLLEETRHLQTQVETKTSLQSDALQQQHTQAKALNSSFITLRKACSHLKSFQTYANDIKQHAWADNIDNSVIETLLADKNLTRKMVDKQFKDFVKQCDQHYLRYLEQQATDAAKEKQVKRTEYKEAIKRRAEQLNVLKQDYREASNVDVLQSVLNQASHQLSIAEQMLSQRIEEKAYDIIQTELRELDQLLGQAPEIYTDYLVEQKQRDQHIQTLQQELTEVLDDLVTKVALPTSKLTSFKKDIDKYHEVLKEFVVDKSDQDDLEEAQECETEIKNLVRRIKATQLYHLATNALPIQDYMIEQQNDEKLVLTPTHSEQAVQYRSITLVSDELNNQILLQAELSSGELLELLFAQAEDGSLALRTAGSVPDGSASCEAFKEIIQHEAFKLFAQELELHVHDHEGNLVDLSEDERPAKKRSGSKLKEQARNL